MNVSHITICYCYTFVFAKILGEIGVKTPQSIATGNMQEAREAAAKVGFPIIVAGLSEKIVEVTDTIFLARYGMIELGAVGLADSMFEMIVFVAVGLAGGLRDLRGLLRITGGFSRWLLIVHRKDRIYVRQQLHSCS